MVSTAALLPPILKDVRGLAFAAALDKSLELDPWQACPLKIDHAPEVVLWELARQFGVAGPLYQAMKTRGQKERLVEMALRLQRKRGTPWAVAEVMRLLGFTDAMVMDRTGYLLYDGEAIHDGAYYFEALFSEWSDYGVRLYIDKDSREFKDYDREQAETLAAEWAPLRCKLVGWQARHVLTTAVENVANEAAKLSSIVLMDKALNTYVLQNYWLRWPKDNGDGGDCEIRWRRLPGSLPLANVATLTLFTQGGWVLDRQDLPQIDLAPNVTYEGVWTLKRADGA